MKSMILVLLTVSSAAIASAQIQFGVKAGYNSATYTVSGTGSSEVNPKSKSGFSGGALVSVPLFSSCFLQPEIMYSQQGASFSENGETAKFNYDYLNIPVLFKFQHESGLFAETGPQIGFLLSGKVEEGGISVDNKDQSQTTDFSWAFGLGYKLQDLGLGIDLRYNLGITNVNKPSTDGSSGSDGSVKNSVFQFGLFYMIK
jgi:hypothetical protein